MDRGGRPVIIRAHVFKLDCLALLNRYLARIEPIIRHLHHDHCFALYCGRTIRTVFADLLARFRCPGLHRDQNDDADHNNNTENPNNSFVHTPMIPPERNGMQRDGVDIFVQAWYSPIMKSFSVIMLIVGFVAVAVFGFAAMDAGGAHRHSGCLIATLNNGLCPTDDSIDSLAFHMNTARIFSTAILGSNIMYLLFFASAFLAFLVA